MRAKDHTTLDDQRLQMHSGSKMRIVLVNGLGSCICHMKHQLPPGNHQLAV